MRSAPVGGTRSAAIDTPVEVGPGLTHHLPVALLVFGPLSRSVLAGSRGKAG